MIDYDIVIVGGGLVGLALANDLATLPLSIAVIDNQQSLEKTLDPHRPELRASAINHSSEAYFRHLNIWDALQHSQRVLTYQDIEVKERQGAAHFEAHSDDLGYRNLGYIIENQLMQNQLFQKLRHPQKDQSAHIDLIIDSVHAIEQKQERAFVHLSDHPSLSAKLVIGADGAHSFVRKHSEARLLQKPYKHHAIVATVETELPHRAIAKQLFYPEGIVAFLPLWQPHRHCLVWSASPEKAAELHRQSAAAVGAELTHITEGWLGRCDIISEQAHFPLIARYTPQFVQSRLILIGDAAHTIHPLAGQGVNLGFRDAQQLGDRIRQLVLKHEDIGLAAHYRAYRWQRTTDTMALLAAMQTIEETFSGANRFKKWVRTVGMNAINHQTTLKKQLIKQALGL